MRLYNTLGRKLEEVTPQKSGEITLYTCGPTVYDYAHIGNLRKFVFDDTLRRVLEAEGTSVKHVMNITDVGHLTSDADEGEDKSEKGARREGKTVRQVADTYTEAFKADMAALSVLAPNVDPARPLNRQFHDTYARATDFIAEQQDMVERLIKNGFAYQTEQAIYFDVTKLPSYGELSGQKLADKEVGVRDEVVTDPNKRHPHDFAVWFFTVGRFADHSMHWPSPWGDGFPGWHLECSAIIHATLEDPISIHTGGVDHIGTHHPNEMAQTEGAFGHPLARLWAHSEFILVDGGKMSKSKSNFYTLKDITDKGFHPLALRLLYLQAHYRSEVNFTWESLGAAQNRLLRLQNFAARRYQGHQPRSGSFDPAMLIMSEFDLRPALQDDLNTPVALSKLEDYINQIEGTDLSDEKFLIEPFLTEIDALFGLQLLSVPDITAGQKNLIAERESARQAKDWQKADRLRNELHKHNLEIDDTPGGPRWKRTKI